MININIKRGQDTLQTAWPLHEEKRQDLDPEEDWHNGDRQKGEDSIVASSSAMLSTSQVYSLFPRNPPTLWSFPRRLLYWEAQMDGRGL